MTRDCSELPNSEAARLAHSNADTAWARARVARQCINGHPINPGSVYFTIWEDSGITCLCRPCADAPARPVEPS